MKAAAPASDLPWACARGSSSGHPIATTEVPKVESAKDGHGPVKGSTYFGMSTSRGGYPLPVTSEDGYQCAGVPPNVSRIVIAIGQLPTDSFGAAPINRERGGLRVSSNTSA
ncbi:hypothetical protein LTR42_012940 [Elasticomyces elasticus]|nr:hypothetical protein LTR42_012940 [Elasticomyces elasticus]